MKKDFVLYAAAAVATAIGGIIHLTMAPNSLGNNVNAGILFLVGGTAQMFWVIPMVRRWGLPWYGMGIVGNAVFVAIWAVTRIPGNPITGRGGSISQNAILAESGQMAYIIITIAIIVYELRNRTKISQHTSSKK
ncbi:MAG TPA: hypothetical protein VIG05_05325 [Candidatus Nitrosotenuis sp.]|jgi:hypothetical protein